ncbi:4a-hydroxytetrahydrobiopterin dehydratase [Pseudooceanicola nanhaiensis]|uniref:4a-hydroxytetrahydrobiopterin dehydratase n=1 Tax=Pseudooceanicola nanhaiensis TaxID=375761 RepID=UPI001CD7FB57|nr:4a-hydroxytetrahydrobiopterin dehydratase [Pseudooceanicola nanhaiensis]MCA0921244.1 4a-hydroxytetrahydrobiopterin dehydratase [Pseudooceanicola nanhaiensis]
MTEHLSETARKSLIDPLLENGWTLEEGAEVLTKTFTFEDFTEAFAWMTRAALWAEKWGHHPDWSNSYKTVIVRLTTHDVGGLSALDAKLARKMDQLTA